MIRIVQIEDNEGDLLLTREALEDTGLPFQLLTFKDGQSAYDYFQSLTECDIDKVPQLVFLDVNLPKRNGFDVLAQIRNSPCTKNTSVVIFSTSSSPFDLEKANAHGATKFVTKPAEIEEFNEAIKKAVFALSSANQSQAKNDS
ncbi:MAG TPA: response regulator [Methanosarcina sp.]|nr:response regulator [Methanosarcina sp.]